VRLFFSALAIMALFSFRHFAQQLACSNLGAHPYFGEQIKASKLLQLIELQGCS
jgi:hypothetical protein